MRYKEDFEYIDKIKAGNKQAFGFLVEKYKDMVYSITLKILKNPDDAKDVAQESFIKAFEKIDTFKKEAKFSTWLYTLTYRRALYFRRLNKIESRELIQPEIEKEQTDFESPIKRLNSSDQKKYIKKAIDSLPETEGLLVILYYLDENSVKEISEITGLTKSHIKVKLFRARKTLKKKLNNLLQADINTIL